MSTARFRFTVREVWPLDIPLIAVMHAECFGDGLGGEVWNAAAIARVLAMPGACGFVAAAWPDDDANASAPRPAGFLLGRAAAGRCEILSLGVPQAWRRRGAGRALLRAVIARARDANATRAVLEVAEDNAAARRLYLAEGFAVVARRPAYYRRGAGPAAAAVIFARDVVR